MQYVVALRYADHLVGQLFVLCLDLQLVIWSTERTFLLVGSRLLFVPVDALHQVNGLVDGFSPRLRSVDFVESSDMNEVVSV